MTYQEKFEQPFFSHYLKEEGSFSAAEANIFISGSNEWKQFEQWPPKNVETKKLYFQPQGKLGFEKVQRTDSWDEYVTDPNKPVPHQGGLIQNRTREYMVDDQRFAANRPDVMVYQTAALTEDITIVGPIKNFLKVSSTGTDADYVVKLIDVYPNDAPSFEGKTMAGYQMMVRGEIMAGKYRNGFDKPQALTPGLVEKVDFVMPDVAHTFKKDIVSWFSYKIPGSHWRNGIHRYLWNPILRPKPTSVKQHSAFSMMSIMRPISNLTS
ncbi:CocE/NonD family hydrolase [Sphingobacterium sp. E70]|uniref:CocE/NonD family hydrolase n=1 Tax=Sphingobacterium sp. E70 TaxID=2853439 RepID=UPI002795BF13|nr:CocE/NonD family hydrolase [Sphingobacterium sp. E70]